MDYPSEVDIHRRLHLYQHQRDIFTAQNHSDQNLNASFPMMWLESSFCLSLKPALITPHPGCSIRAKGEHFALAFLPPLICLYRMAGIEK